MKRLLIPTLALAAALPGGLQAQDEGDAASRIDAALARAEAAGVPMESMEARQAEGKAKGVPLDRLAEAMEHRAEALIAARDAMPESDESTVAAGADAVEMGIGKDVLGYIESTVPGERRFVAVFALSRLAALGHEPADALQKVEEALARGPEALAEVAEQADEALARRGPPEGIGPASLPDVASPPAGVPAPGATPAGRPDGVPAGGPPGGGGG